jgi:hypothetical protein
MATFADLQDCRIAELQQGSFEGLRRSILPAIRQSGNPAIS